MLRSDFVLGLKELSRDTAAQETLNRAVGANQRYAEDDGRCGRCTHLNHPGNDRGSSLNRLTDIVPIAEVNIAVWTAVSRVPGDRHSLFIQDKKSNPGIVLQNPRQAIGLREPQRPMIDIAGKPFREDFEFFKRCGNVAMDKERRLAIHLLRLLPGLLGPVARLEQAKQHDGRNCEADCEENEQ